METLNGSSRMFQRTAEPYIDHINIVGSVGPNCQGSQKGSPSQSTPKKIRLPSRDPGKPRLRQEAHETLKSKKEAAPRIVRGWAPATDAPLKTAWDLGSATLSSCFSYWISVLGV